jgi:hypothetical protein
VVIVLFIFKGFVVVVFVLFLYPKLLPEVLDVFVDVNKLEGGPQSVVVRMGLT